MSRWSLRRRQGVAQDDEGDYQPVTVPSVAGPPWTAPSLAGQQAEEASASSRRKGNPLEPDRGRQGQPGPGRPDSALDGTGQYGTGQYGTGQYGTGVRSTGRAGADRYGADRYGADRHEARQAGNGVAVLAPVRQPAPAAPHAPASAAVPEAGPTALPAAQGPAAQGPGDQATSRADGVWPDICDQFGLHLLVLAEQLRASLDELEADEDDAERLRRLYQVDHAVTRMRRASRDLRTLAGRGEEELAGFTTSLLDIVRMGASAIERYTQVKIGRVADLAVLGFAADDIGSVVAALLDNATRYSPGTVTVSGHLLEDGGVMFRIEDSGIGIGAEQVAALNASFLGPVPAVDERTGRHTGFPVVHRIARKHSLTVRLAARPRPGSGMVAMVTLPPHLLCEVPSAGVQRRPAPASPATPQGSPPQTPVPDLSRGEAALSRGEAAGEGQPPRWAPPEPPEPPESPDRGTGRVPGPGGPERAPGGLPRRERASLRGARPRPKPQARGMVPTAQQQAAARRAFADDLSAFSLGLGGPPGGGQAAGGQAAGGIKPASDSGPAGDGDDVVTSATEEEPQL